MFCFFFLMIRRPPRSTQSRSSAASDVYKRQPVRDALNRLAAEGLVEDVARKGYFVARLDPEEIADLLDARRLIELAAVEEGIDRVEPDQLAEMRRLFIEMRQLFDDEGNCLDYAEFSKRDSLFHQLVVSTAGNRRLLHIYRSLSVHLHIFRTNLAAQGGYRRSLASVREHAVSYTHLTLPTIY